MTPPWVERLAAAFWDRAGGPPPPPRDIEPVVSLVGPVWVRPAHPVTPAGVRDWLRRRGRVLPNGTDDSRPLFGCVVAYRGWCVVVVDERLPADERRVIVAHEVGHFLAEYLWPRERALRRLGPAVTPVLDGERPPTTAEEWAGVLAGVRLGVHAHFLERGFDPTADDTRNEAERTANALALELLAPWREVLAASGSESSVGALLVDRYGLPCSWAAGYARRLARVAERTRPPSRIWGL